MIDEDTPNHPGKKHNIGKVVPGRKGIVLLDQDGKPIVKDATKQELNKEKESN